MLVQVLDADRGGHITSIASSTAIIENGTTTFDHLVISGAADGQDMACNRICSVAAAAAAKCRRPTVSGACLVSIVLGTKHPQC